MLRRWTAVERSVALPLQAASGALAGAVRAWGADLPVGAPSLHRFDDRLPWAPPLA